MMSCLTSGNQPRFAVVEEKTPAGTHWVLAQVALGPAGSLATFDDVVDLAVKASDSDQCQAEIKFISCPREDKN
jgi:hypothetical protein